MRCQIHENKHSKVRVRVFALLVCMLVSRLDMVLVRALSGRLTSRPGHQRPVVFVSGRRLGRPFGAV